MEAHLARQEILHPGLCQGLHMTDDSGRPAFYHYGRLYGIDEIRQRLEELPSLLDQVTQEGPRGPSREERERYSYFTADELDRIEEEHAEGITADDIVRLCRAKGMRLSKPTLRLYVSRGILEPSERRKRPVKGKRYSSVGYYPSDTIRGIARTKYLLEEELLTIEDVALQASATSLQIQEAIGASTRELINKKNEIVSRLEGGRSGLEDLLLAVETLIVATEGLNLIVDCLEEDESSRHGVA